MIVVESPSKRYRAVLTETASGIEVQLFDRGRGATRGMGEEFSVTHLDGASLVDAQTAVYNHLLTLPNGTKEEPA